MAGSPARDRNLRLLRQVYEGLESGDVEVIRAVLAPTIVVHLAGVPSLEGTYRGIAEVERLYRNVVEELGRRFTVPAHDVLVHDESLVVVPRGTSFGAADRGMDVYHFDGERISEIWLTAWTPADEGRDAAR